MKELETKICSIREDFAVLHLEHPTGPAHRCLAVNLREQAQGLGILGFRSHTNRMVVDAIFVRDKRGDNTPVRIGNLQGALASHVLLNSSLCQFHKPLARLENRARKKGSVLQSQRTSV